MNLTPFFVGALLALPAQPSIKLDVELAFSKSALAEPFSGRVFVIASKTPINDKAAPPGPSWFKPYPFFAQDVTKWTPDTPLKFEPAHAMQPWGKLDKGKYYLQAILDRDGQHVMQVAQRRDEFRIAGDVEHAARLVG